MKTLILLLLASSVQAAVGPQINGNQINPQTAISIATMTVTGATGLTVTNAATVGGSALVVTGGKVGIGTTVPSSKVAIYYPSKTALGAVASSALHLENLGNPGELGQISFGYTNLGANTYAPGIIYSTNTNGAGQTAVDLAFGTRVLTTDSAPLERMRITAAGNVGIGTASPATALHVVGDDTFQLSNQIVISSGSANAGQTFGKITWGVATSDSFDILSPAGHDMGLDVNGATAVIIPKGNVTTGSALCIAANHHLGVCTSLVGAGGACTCTAN